jgi:hypothetical protein
MLAGGCNARLTELGAAGCSHIRTPIAPRGVTVIYQLHEVAAVIAEDTARLRVLLKLQRTEIHTMTYIKQKAHNP